ncbi:MAG: tRNA (adenosine(37)-N6)-threonylcarbamoyltransferase complex dimerization subunit type 1 TsaB [Bacillota bacterium]
MPPLVLAIEASTALLGVALVSRERVLCEVSLEKPRAHSSYLLPICMDVMDKVGVTKDDISCIATSGGPGSFTGLRIGAATAQGLGYSWDKPVVMVPAFQVYLYGAHLLPNVAVASGKASAQAVSGFYVRASEGPLEDQWPTWGFREAVPVRPRDVRQFLELLKETGENPVYVTGDGSSTLMQCPEREGLTLRLLDPYWGLPRPGVLGLIGARMFEAGLSVTPQRALPDYMRLSQAEVRRAENTGLPKRLDSR